MRARACAQLQKLPENVGFVQSDDREAQLAGVTWLRKILSIGAPAARARPQNCQAAARLPFVAFKLLHFAVCAERGPPIDQVIQSGVIPRLVQFLTAIDENGDAIPQLQVLSPPARTRYCPSL